MIMHTVTISFSITGRVSDRVPESFVAALVTHDDRWVSVRHKSLKDYMQFLLAVYHQLVHLQHR